jgi:hypothetical protein
VKEKIAYKACKYAIKISEKYLMNPPRGLSGEDFYYILQWRLVRVTSFIDKGNLMGMIES